MTITPITLEGQHVRLEPLSLAHLDALCEVGLDEDLWRWTPDQARTRDDMRTYILEALAGQERGTMLPFATVLRAESRVVGSTRFGNIDLRHRRVEIGWTWIARSWQRTAVNTEAKLLMLRHAFETLGCIRVELKTDALNDRSRQAILRLGAKEEGIFRQHMVMPAGHFRDTVYYSILDREWPEIKVKLGERLDGPHARQVSRVEAS